MRYFKLVLIFFIVSCSKENIEVFKSADQILVKHNDKKLIIFVKGDFDIEKIKKILSFYTPLKSNEMHEIDSYYSLFFRVGNNYYSDIKNDVIRFGLIEIDWLNFKSKIGEKREFFRVKEIDKYIENFSEKDKRDAFKFAVKYLAEKDLFVSIQEFFDRPFRYFSIFEIETLFTRMVVMPEAKEFTEYIINRFGRNKVIKFGKKEYSKERWKKYFGENINDVEEEFFKYIKDYKFSSSFDKDLLTLIKIYNKNSKKTLFKK